MTSAPVRDPLADHLLTPQNTAFVPIDNQPQQLVAVHSMDRALLVENAVSAARTIKTFGVPVAHSAVNVTNGREAEMCMAFAALDELREGYEVYPVIDAFGGTSPEAHRAGLDCVIQAGGQPISWVWLAGELLRDRARAEALAIAEIVVTDRLARSKNAPRQPRLAASLTAKKAS